MCGNDLPPVVPGVVGAEVMKITDIAVTLTETPVRHQFRWREGLPGSGTSNTGARIDILTDEA